MIAKINKGSNFTGLMNYLEGPGRKEEHKDCRSVAGNLFSRDGEKMAEELRDVADQNERCVRPVFHASLRLPPQEASALDDAAWGKAARTFMGEMGFQDQDGRDVAPWTAIRHGEDHIHIVASRVGFDGRVVSDAHDFRRSHEASRVVEKEHGLSSPEKQPREAGRLAAVSISERESALRRGVQPERAQLRAAMESARELSSSRADFERRCEERGVLLRANVASTGRMNGYSASLGGWKDSGGEQVWLAGSKVHKSLRWADLRKELEERTKGEALQRDAGRKKDGEIER